MYTCPLRNIEIRRLKVSEIDMKEKYFYPSRAKGGRECEIPILASTYQVLEKYLAISRPRLLKISGRSDIEELLITEEGTPFSANMVNKIFARYREGKMHIHPHAMRRACAVEMIKNGASIRDVQVLLGHRSVISTQRYTPLATNDLRDMQDKHHPRERYAKSGKMNK